MTSHPSFVFERDAIAAIASNAFAVNSAIVRDGRLDGCEFNLSFKRRQIKVKMRVGCEQRKKALCLAWSQCCTFRVRSMFRLF